MPSAIEKKLRELASAATPGPWNLDHADMYVAVDNPGSPHDWYWITGAMDRLEDGYNAEVTDEDMRGPKETVQANCRYISAANPATLLALLDALDVMRVGLNDIRDCSTFAGVNHVARQALAQADKLLGAEQGWVACQTCGHRYSKLELESCRFTLLGYEPGNTVTTCHKCRPSERKTPKREGAE